MDLPKTDQVVGNRTLRLPHPSVVAVAAALAERFGPGEEPALRSSILGFVGALGAAVAELVADDEAHYADKAVLATLRRQRDQITRHLTRLVVGLRRAVVALHVRPDLARLGFAAETPREPVPLLRQVDRIVATFENGPVATLLGPPLFDHARLDPQGYPQPLRKEADALRGILDKVGEAQRRVEEALLRKRAARGEYDHLFLRAARIFENCCHLVGWTELADRVRPSRSRRGQTGQELTAEASGEVVGEAPDGASVREVAGTASAGRRTAWAGRPVGRAGAGTAWGRRVGPVRSKSSESWRRRGSIPAAVSMFVQLPEDQAKIGGPDRVFYGVDVKTTETYTHVLNRGAGAGWAPPSESGRWAARGLTGS